MSTIISAEGLEEIRKAATARGWVHTEYTADWVDPSDTTSRGPARILWTTDGRCVSVLGEKTVTYPVALPISWLLSAVDEAYPLPAEPPNPAPTPTTAAPIEGSVAAVEGPSVRDCYFGERALSGSAFPAEDVICERCGARGDGVCGARAEPAADPEPTVGSPEGRALIDAEARLRGWVDSGDGDWHDASGPPEWRIVIDDGALSVQARGRIEWVALDRPVSEAIAAIRRLYPLPEAATETHAAVVERLTRERDARHAAAEVLAHRADGLCSDLDAALTSIREATHTLATALDHDTEAALVLETAAKEVARRWRRDREQLVDAHAALDDMPATRAPDITTPGDRIRHATRAWREERAEADRYAALCQEAHDVLDAAGVAREGTPAQRVRLLVERADILDAERREVVDEMGRLGARGAHDDRRVLVLATALLAVAPDVAARLGVSLG